MRVGVNCRPDIPVTIKVDTGESGMCVALDTSGVGLGVEQKVSMGGGVALAIGLHDGRSSAINCDLAFFALPEVDKRVPASDAFTMFWDGVATLPRCGHRSP